MPAFITENHLKAGNKRKTYSDAGPKGQTGFVLRTTPKGVLTSRRVRPNWSTARRR